MEPRTLTVEAGRFKMEPWRVYTQTIIDHIALKRYLVWNRFKMKS
jgi:hypothetical protein